MAGRPLAELLKAAELAGIDPASLPTNANPWTLNTELFATVAEAQGLPNRWRWEYNTLRPHSALQVRTPLEAAQAASA